MPNWKKVIVSGSDAALNTLTVSNGVGITGSLLVTGSVILSGSKTGGANPSIKIDGGVQLDGYLRFEPVDVSINTSISASYIFVSGSTRDLYFAQNGIHMKMNY